MNCDNEEDKSDKNETLIQILGKSFALSIYMTKQDM